MIASPSFVSVLTATGYLSSDGEAVDGLHTRDGTPPARVRHILGPHAALPVEAVFTTHGAPFSMFMDVGDRHPGPGDFLGWHEKAWNVGLAPLLWIVTADEVRIYDCYARRAKPGSRRPTHLLRVPIADRLKVAELREAVGRLTTETGAFWSSKIGQKIDRRHRVDRQLLDEISELEDALAKATVHHWLGHTPVDLSKIPRETREAAIDYAQKLIARTILAWYIVDRRIADRILPDVLARGLPSALADAVTGLALFEWMQGTFNGDLYPSGDLLFDRRNFTSRHADLLRSFARSEVVASGQGRLFKFRFESIPIDLISSVYQQFTRSLAGDKAKQQSLHYTSVELADMVLDPVFDGLPYRSRVLDPTCGSGIFLVEAFRRLVWKRCGDAAPARAVVREVLYECLHGIDVNPAALRIAAFSLVLAALELDGEPVERREDLQFHQLIGRNLHEIDLLRTPTDNLRRIVGEFDVVVGNPPWTFASEPVVEDDSTPGDDGDANGAAAAPSMKGGDEGTGGEGTSAPRRSPDHDFVRKSVALLRPKGRVGLVLKATPFYTVDHKAERARRELLKRLAPVALVNLSQLRLEKLFPNARGAALLLFARCPLVPDDGTVLVGSAPWSASFRRSGVIEIGPADFRRVPMSAIEARAKLLKAASVGSFRDVQVMDRLEQEFPTLSEVLDAIGIRADQRRGQGLIVGHPPGPLDFEADERTKRQNPKLRDVPPWLRRLPFYGPDLYKGNYVPFRIPNGRMPTYDLHHPERIRGETVFEGPLLLCPKGQLKSGIVGRYSAALVEESVAYTQNFYGISFRGIDPDVSSVLSGFLNSALAAYQLAMGSGAVGIERSAVSPQDLLSLRLPFVADWHPSARTEVVEREAVAARGRSDADLGRLDEAVFDLFDLDHEERTVVREGLDRNRWMFVDSREEFERVVRRPEVEDYAKYATAVVRTINAFLEGEDRHLRAEIVSPGGGDTARAMSAVRFRIHPGEPGPTPIVGTGFDDVSVWDLLSPATDGASAVPYLNERRVLRVYGVREVVICKPAEWRHWTETAGLNDADTILDDHRMTVAG